ncbi:MAG: SGNH/GDSL hydrolase family protein [Patescibacteria group bacterium]|jgi:lysophospholipase L1-like esterase
MKKKITIISIALFIILTAYLAAAHYYIYKKISGAGLKSPDTMGEYIIRNEKNNEANIIYTALGDSLAAGVGVLRYEESYPYRIAQKISGAGGNITLRDRAYPGAKTSDLINDLLTAAINDRPDIVTLLIGVNDIHGNVSKTKFSENYKEILTRLKDGTKAKIFAVSIPYLGTNTLLLPPYNLYIKLRTIEYNKIIKELARENNIEYVDLYAPTELMFKDSSLYSADLFHPSAKGYELWAEIIYADINK